MADSNNLRADAQDLIDPCSYGTYNGCQPTILWVEASMLRLALRVLFLSTVLMGASLVFADELVLTALMLNIVTITAAALVWGGRLWASSSAG